MRNWLRSLTPERRQAIYRLAIALGGVLVAYGVVSSDKWVAVSGVLFALTNFLADSNVPLPVDVDLGSSEEQSIDA